MTRQAIARRTSDGTTGAPCWELIAGAKPCWVKELSITLAAATASTFGLGRPAAIGVGPTTPVVLLGEAGGDANEAVASTAVAWGTSAPTIPAQFFRRIGLPATIGVGVTWTFPTGIHIPAGGTLIVWNLAANAVVDISVVVEV